MPYSSLMSYPGFVQKAQKIKLIIFDVDGVLTDGRIYMDDQGNETKAFHVLDGQGIKLLHQYNINTAVISGRQSKSVLFRLEQLNIRHIFLGRPDKLPVYLALLRELSLKDEQVAYMGDDLPDLPALGRAGLAVTVPNAVSEVQDKVSFMTQLAGGKGAVRQMCDALLKSQEHWPAVMKNYS